ncbi:ABC-type oligopeptide transport system, ATPase component [Bacillus sp. OxB-1]|uniref:ABC transporter ATP-binding protein n=1 Tax=Bacillus sp. (strain OxB-1) TaxID=98228 RepID=UPI00058217C7|nr:oligopeptide/dipeptide ABC transporter ATP-binding protein [Bacillus sp. OxB-1]BAQ09997.1 ABC-type oligopeptide transport system, ATPase component [Bacillus sp. OxB-1]
MSQVVLKVENLNKHFPTGKRNLLGKHTQTLKAVDGVSFEIKEGEIFGLVGESGCGKSTLGRCITRIVDPSTGKIHFNGEEITNSGPDRLKELRRQMQMVFQNPHSSLNPRMTIRQTFSEILKVHRLAKGQEQERMEEILTLVGLPADALDRHPHEFSGGQLQRIVIARALLVEPQFIMADEPVSALDVSVQAQILNLLVTLKEELSLTILFVAHDLSVVEHISDRVGVMYLGQIVEMADVDDLYQNTLHPYTLALMAAIPVPDPTVKKEYEVIEGDLPSPIDLPAGCRFAGRCPSAMAVCQEQNPSLKEVNPGHFVACHLYY